MKTYMIGDTIVFRVRIDGDPTVDNPTAVVRDPSEAIVGSPLTLGSGLTQVDSTRVVVGSFVPTAAGEYSVSLVDDTGLDVVKQFHVGPASIESLGTSMGTANAGIVSLEAHLAAQDILLTDILSQVSSINGGGHFG